MDFGEGSRFALDCAALLRTHVGAVVDAYYVWPAGGGDDGCAALRELETFSRREGAWETFSHLGDLDRRGLIRIRGYLTPSGSGQSLISLANEGGYQIILEAAESPVDERFVVHGGFSADAPAQTIALGRCGVSSTPSIAGSTGWSRRRRGSRTSLVKP